VFTIINTQFPLIGVATPPIFFFVGNELIIKLRTISYRNKVYNTQPKPFFVFNRKKKSLNLDEILDECLRKKTTAQKELYERFYGFAKSIAQRYASSSDEVHEMMNDGFLKVFAKLDMYDRGLSFEAWFKTVMVRTCIDYYRKNHSRVGMVDIDELHYLSYEDHLLEKLSAEEILDLMKFLPPSYKAVFSLYIVDGYSHAEIGKMLGINEGTSRSNLSKARLKMQELIKKYTSEVKDYRNVI
jgi:RNA polymerase sigma-70 factor, ECF subfamily